MSEQKPKPNWDGILEASISTCRAVSHVLLAVSKVVALAFGVKREKSYKVYYDGEEQDSFETEFEAEMFIDDKRRESDDIDSWEIIKEPAENN